MFKNQVRRDDKNVFHSLEMEILTISHNFPALLEKPWHQRAFDPFGGFPPEGLPPGTLLSRLAGIVPGTLLSPLTLVCVVPVLTRPHSFRPNSLLFSEEQNIGKVESREKYWN